MVKCQSEGTDYAFLRVATTEHLICEEAFYPGATLIREMGSLFAPLSQSRLA